MDSVIALLPKMKNAKEEETIVEALDSGGFIVPFDWPAWQEEGRRFVLEPALIETADLATLCHLYTLHVRKDRFCEGHFGAMLANGHIAALTWRLMAIRENGLA